MKPRSLIRRVILAVLLIELLCACGFVSTALWHEWHTRFHALDVALQGRSDSLIGAVQDAEDPEDNVTVDPAEFKPSRGDCYAVFNDRGRLIGASKDEIPELTARGQDGFRNVRAGGHRYRVLQSHALRIIDRYETDGVGLRRPIVVLYATSTDHIWRGLVESANFYLLVSLGLLCVTAIVLVLILRRLLAPLEQLADRAAAIDANTLTFNPPAAAMGVRELMPLAEALAAMVARVHAAFEAQHRFIHDAAHELKTAVSVERSSIQVLGMRNRTPEEYRAGLDRVLGDNERVEELVQQMLSLARFEEQGGASPTWIDFGVTVREAAENLDSIAEARELALRCSIENGVMVRLSTDAARTLASNLILNALQHSPRGSEVMVAVAMQGQGEPVGMLTVRDFGSGIAPENLGRIFERFFREDPSRSRQTGGAGLGLAICKSIVDGAGGEIRVESEPGKGTLITVTLPAAERDIPLPQENDSANVTEPDETAVRSVS